MRVAGAIASVVITMAAPAGSPVVDYAGHIVGGNRLVVRIDALTPRTIISTVATVVFRSPDDLAVTDSASGVLAALDMQPRKR